MPGSVYLLRGHKWQLRYGINALFLIMTLVCYWPRLRATSAAVKGSEVKKLLETALVFN